MLSLSCAACFMFASISTFSYIFHMFASISMFRCLPGRSVRMSATSSQKVVLKSTTKVSLNER